MDEFLDLGLVTRVRSGVYLRTEVWQNTPSWERADLQLSAHSLLAPGHYLYTHQSAARLYGLRTWGLDQRIHVNLPYRWSRDGFAADLVSHYSTVAPDEERLVINDSGQAFRVTSLERTVTDCARMLGLERSVVIGDHALREGANLTQMNTMLAKTPGSRGVRRARAVLAALDPRSESVGESRTRLLLSAMNIEQPEPQLVIETNSGSFRADFGWREAKVILEFDGKNKYFDFSPTENVVFKERRREKALIAAGWQVIRIEWTDLDRPVELRRRLVAALNKREFAV